MVDGKRSAMSESWAWLTDKRRRRGVLTVLVGLTAGSLAIGICGAIWGPWEQGQEPDGVYIAATVVAVPAGLTFWKLWRPPSEADAAGTPAVSEDI